MLFSIITINYNNIEGLRQTCDSVLCQTSKDFEWIIVDGGSKDGSKEFIEEVAGSLKGTLMLTFWCSEPDKGIYNAMNKGIEHSQGDYLIFLNSGDMFYDKNVLDNINCIGISSDIFIGEVVEKDNCNKLFNHYNPEEGILLHLLRMSLAHQGTFFKRSLFQRFRYDETLSIVSDWKLFLETLVFNNCTFGFTNHFVAIQDMKGISNINLEKGKTERALVLSELFPKLVLENLYKYKTLYDSTYVRNGIYLEKKCKWMYLFVRKMTSFFIKAHKKIRIKT